MARIKALFKVLVKSVQTNHNLNELTFIWPADEKRKAMILVAELRLKGLLKRSLKNLGFIVIRSRSFPISILVGPHHQMNYEATPKQRDKF